MNHSKLIDLICHLERTDADERTDFLYLMIKSAPEVALEIFSNKETADLNLFEREIYNFLKSGRKIDAIRAIRTETGLGLEEAKTKAEEFKVKFKL